MLFTNEYFASESNQLEQFVKFKLVVKFLLNNLNKDTSFISDFSDP